MAGRIRSATTYVWPLRQPSDDALRFATGRCPRERRSVVRSVRAPDAELDVECHATCTRPGRAPAPPRRRRSAWRRSRAGRSCAAAPSPSAWCVVTPAVADRRLERRQGVLRRHRDRPWFRAVDLDRHREDPDRGGRGDGRDLDPPVGVGGADPAGRSPGERRAWPRGRERERDRHAGGACVALPHGGDRPQQPGVRRSRAGEAERWRDRQGVGRLDDALATVGVGDLVGPAPEGGQEVRGDRDRPRRQLGPACRRPAAAARRRPDPAALVGANETTCRVPCATVNRTVRSGTAAPPLPVTVATMPGACWVIGPDSPRLISAVVGRGRHDRVAVPLRGVEGDSADTVDGLHEEAQVRGVCARGQLGQSRVPVQRVLSVGLGRGRPTATARSPTRRARPDQVTQTSWTPAPGHR